MICLLPHTVVASPFARGIIVSRFSCLLISIALARIGNALAQYQDPAQADSLTKVQKELDLTKEFMVRESFQYTV